MTDLGDALAATRDELVALLGVADAVTMDRARELLELIRRRGYHRERDLVADLDSLTEGR